MTAPADLMPGCDGEQVSPGGRIGSGGEHDGGKDRTIRTKIPPKNIALAIISAPL